MNSDITEFLAQPLGEHPHGVRAGVEEATTVITARVESWSTEEESR